MCELDDVDGPGQVLDVLAGEDLDDDELDLLEHLPGGKLVALVHRLRRHFAVLHPPADGFTRVIHEIDRYGEAIEADLHAAFGLDLLDWFRDHDRWPWSKLLRLLERTPEAGHYETARRGDDELAREIADAQERGELPAASKRPRLLGWTHERELLTAILEETRRNTHGIWAASPKFRGKGGRAPRNLARPQAAADRLASLALLAEHDEIGAALLGERYQPRLSAAPGERMPSPSAIRGAVLLDAPA